MDNYTNLFKYKPTGRIVAANGIKGDSVIQKNYPDVTGMMYDTMYYCPLSDVEFIDDSYFNTLNMYDQIRYLEKLNKEE